ncbi:class I SAM-dependent methyltransferase [Terracidiphilus sp.]|jgi:SAM-dependent methyltransferase|uniref:class I SAM-dependent methyltransferase n=1 Tax=Terracidiphilus sp. TaxID=1964191 RepID=UPI003C1EA36C
METLLERIRRAELDCVRKYFAPGARVLEIGGGSGFQASLLAEHGCEVTSIDVATRPDPRAQRYARQYYPVSTYDGSRLPFAEAGFDVVFSSHALYHACTLESMLAEIRRVLRPEGFVILILPASSWRVYTSLLHYPDLVRKVIARLSRNSARKGAETDTTRSAQRARLRDVLANRPISPAPNVFAEWGMFRRGRWSSAFIAAGFEVRALCGGPLFYTGQLFAPELPFGARAALARIMGASSFVCVGRR